MVSVINFNQAISNKLNALKDTELKGHHVFDQTISDASLEKRFSKAQKYPHNISFDFTSDKYELSQYFAIRETCYKEYLGLNRFSGEQDQFDGNSDIMVVKAGGKCVGGARITISRPNAGIELPFEAESYDLASYFPDFDFANTTYCETSRMAFLPEFRNGEFVGLLCKLLAEHAIRSGAETGFAMAPMIQARRYKTVLTNLGYNVVIRDDINLPKIDKYEHIQLMMCAVDFTADRRHSAALSGAPVIEYAPVATEVDNELLDA